MESRRVGRSGLEVSRLGLGTMTWGRDTDADAAAAQLEAFVGAGGTLIDTANIYGDGDAESILGTLVPDVVARSSVVLSTTTVGVGGGRGRLLAALDGSLGRLGTDHVDLWQVHGFDPAVPFEETCSALRDGGGFRPDPVCRGVRGDRLAAGDPGRLAAGRRRRAPRWCRWRRSTRCWSAGRSSRCCRRPAVHGARLAGLGGAGPGGADRQVPARHPGRLPRCVTAFHPVRRPVPHRAGGAHRGGGGHRRRRARHVAAGGGLRLGPRPARGVQRGDRRHGTARSCSARWPPRRSRCPPRSAARWTTSAPAPGGRLTRPQPPILHSGPLRSGRCRWDARRRG